MVALDEQFHHKGAKARSRRHCGSEAAQSEKSLARRIIDVASPRRRDTSISSPNSCVKFSNQQSVSNSFASFCRCGENRFRFIDHRPLIFKRSADAYGNTLIFTGPGPDGLWFTDDDVQSVYGANEIIYCGYRFDAETQLYYVRNRTYSPVLGRWIQRDPIGYSGGINLYAYVESSPVGKVDANGLYAFAGVQKPVPAAGLGDAAKKHPLSGGRYYQNYYYTEDLGDVMTDGEDPSEEPLMKLAETILHGLTRFSPVGEIIAHMAEVISQEGDIEFAFRGTAYPWVTRVYFCTGKLQSVTLKSWKKTNWASEPPHGPFGVGGLVIGGDWKEQDRDFVKSLLDVAKELKSGGE